MLNNGCYLLVCDFNAYDLGTQMLNNFPCEGLTASKGVIKLIYLTD